MNIWNQNEANGKDHYVHVERGILLWFLAEPLLPTGGCQQTRRYRLDKWLVDGDRMGSDLHEQIAISTAFDVMDISRSARSSPQ